MFESSRKRWDRENSKKITFQFYLDKDKELLERLDSCPNKTEYIRKLINKDIKETKEVSAKKIIDTNILQKEKEGNNHGIQ